MDKSESSPLGIASVIFSAIGAILFFIWITSSGSPGFTKFIIGFLVVSQIFVSLLGTGLGIAPLFSSSKNRGFAITGVVVGVATLVLSGSVLGVGVYVMSAGQ